MEESKKEGRREVYREEGRKKETKKKEIQQSFINIKFKYQEKLFLIAVNQQPPESQ